MVTDKKDNLYQFTMDIQSWDRDPYYVGSSWPVHRGVQVIASTKPEALEEARRLLGDPGNGRYWRFFNITAVDVRLITKEAEAVS